jgi:hypothetical protein
MMMLQFDEAPNQQVCPIRLCDESVVRFCMMKSGVVRMKKASIVFVLLGDRVL